MTINPYESPRALFIPPPADDGDPTLLKFDLELDDIVNFHRFHQIHSSTVKMQRYVTFGLISLAIGLVNMATFFAPPLIINTEDQFQLMMTALVLPLAAIFLAEMFFRWSVVSQFRKRLKNGDNTFMLGERELRLTDIGLYETSEFSQSRFPYGRIGRIEENADYVFIYISSIQAHIIPKKKLLAGNLEGFMDTLRNHMQQA